jgi:hypothetical protein
VKVSHPGVDKTIEAILMAAIAAAIRSAQYAGYWSAEEGKRIKLQS